MTKIEMYENIINGVITEEMVALATAEVAKNAEEKAQKSADNEAVQAPIREYLAEHPYSTAQAIANAIGLSREKVTVHCTMMSKSGVLVKGTTMSTTPSGKDSIVKTYALA